MLALDLPPRMPESLNIALVLQVSEYPVTECCF